MKYKTINYLINDGAINYRLNDKKLYLVYNGIKHIKSKINTNIDLIISNDGSICSNLDINISKKDIDTYEITYPDQSIEQLDILYYYKNSLNERTYVTKSDVVIDIDGVMKYEGHIIKTYYKSESGLSLYGDYNDFINSDNYNFKNENITSLEQEIFNINSTIEDLLYQRNECLKLNDQVYNNYEEAKKTYERLTRELSQIQVNMNEALKDNYESYYFYKDSYYSHTKKELGQAYGIIEDPSNIDDLCTNSSINQFLYTSENGRNMEINNLKGFYYDRHPVTNYYNNTANVTPFENLTPSYRKAKYYEQLFTYEAEALTNQIQSYSNLIEQISWTYQKQINNKAQEINTANIDLNDKKTIYETKYNKLVKDYYELCVRRFNLQIEYYNKILLQKQEQLSILKKQIPVIYLVNEEKTLIYGFNEYNKLCIIFDNYNHQLLINYDDTKIISLVDQDNNKLELIYNDNNKLIKLINDIGEEISINYIDDKVSTIVKDNNIVKLEYLTDLLYKIIDTNKLGYKFEYDNNLLDKIYKISKENNIKDLHEYLYLDNEVTIIDKTKYIFINDEYIYSEYGYIFDNTNSLLTEIEYKNNEIENILGYEYDSNHCNFKFNTSKKDKTIFNIESQEFSGIKTYNVELPEVIKTDYTLYAILEANSLPNINEYRTTSYCSHIYNESNIKYEMRVVISYQDLDITYGVSFNPNIEGKNLASIPITLKEDINGSVIRPLDINIYVDYTNNNGICMIHNLVLSECSYQYIEYNDSKQIKELYLSDVTYPLLNNSIKTGYVIKSISNKYSYNINELKEKEETITRYEKYNLNDELIDLKEEKYIKNYSYDSKSNITKISDSKLNIVLNEYDDKGNIIKNITYNDTNSSNIIVKDYQYDNDGNLISDSNILGFNNKYKETLNEIFEESPNGFIKTVSNSYIKSDLLSNSIYGNNDNMSYVNDNINYRYEYDEWGLEKSLYINDNLYMEFSYNEYLGKKYYLSKYSNNKGYLKVTDLYDKLLYIKKINNEVSEILLNYNYDLDDNLISIKDKDNNTIESYLYIDNTLSEITNNNYIKKYSNDIYGNITSVSYDNDIYNYRYNEDKNITMLSHNGFNEELKYDSLKRIISKNNNIINESYEYLNVNNRSTNLIKLIKQDINNKVIYNKFYYDNCGNIIKSVIDHNLDRYYYDGLNRLIRFDSSELNHTYTYSFDDRNNIISKGIHDYTNDDLLLNSEYIDYNYDNDNKLISYDNNEISYDSSLRPINYKGNTLLWDNNKLIQYGNNNYLYDYNGLRIKKILENEEIEYVRDGTKLLKEIHTLYNSSITLGRSISNGEEAISSDENVIIYNYGVNGIIGFTLNNINYYYIKNIFNDVVKIIDDNYNIVSEYVYDAYGKCYITKNINDIANINPIRYRSYYYDKETGLYYLNSRYYDPDTMRFISMDDISYLEYQVLGGLNLFTYCNNNPIMNIDPEGTFFISLTALIVGAVVGATLAFGTVAYMDYKDDGYVFNGSIKWYDYLGATILGGAIGAISGAAIGGITGMSFTATIPTFGFINAGGALSIGITGSVTLTVSGTQILAGVGLAGLGIMAIIPKHGAPNTKIKDGGSFGEYDENGNLSYRVDTTGKPHYIKSEKRYALPHIHKFTWKLVNGVWRYIEEVLSYFL